MKFNLLSRISLASLFLACFTSYSTAVELPSPDQKPADTSKKVKVFIVMGQSNTLEMGKVKGDQEGSLEYAVKNENLYPFMLDKEGNWSVRQDVRNVHTQGSGGPQGRGGVRRNDWLTVSGGKIGIEQGIGHQLGNFYDEPVLILKSSIGNRSLRREAIATNTPNQTARPTFMRVRVTPLTAGRKALNPDR